MENSKHPQAHSVAVSRPVAAVLVVSAALAGCLGAGPAPDLDPVCQVAAYPLHTLPLQGTDRDLATDPDRAWDGLVRATPEDGVDVSVREAPDGWDANRTELGVGLQRIRLAPTSEAGDGTAHVRWTDGESCGRRGDGTWHLRSPAKGEVASPGQGVHVYTAGFWPNGTLFYTNIEAVHESDWPRASWYSWGGGEPLPVYVYDEDPDERPAYWSVSASAPVAGTVTAWNYFVTIPGFNEGLKDLSTTTTRVVEMPPDQAYTREGNEDHPLYGDRLIFYSYITDVVDRPCRTTAADTCTPLD